MIDVHDDVHFMISTEHFEMLDIQNGWKREIKLIGKLTLKLIIQLMPDLTKNDKNRFAHLLVSIKVENRRPESKYEVHTTTALCGNNLPGKENSKIAKISFQDDKDNVNFMVKLAPQKKIEESTDTALKLHMKVEAFQLPKRHTTFNDFLVV